MRTHGISNLRGRSALGLLPAALTVAALAAGPVSAADGDIVQAARAQDAAAVLELIETGADVNTAARDGSTALLWAAYHYDVQMVHALIAAGADADAANRYGVTPLLQASRTGDTPVVEALLAGGADPNVTHPDGETALMAASRAGRVDAVRLLLEHGADPNTAESFQDQTALMWAAAEGHTDVVDALLAAGADPDLRARVSSLTERKNADHPTGGFTALMWAVRDGHEDTVRRLAEGGADLDLTNGDGATATMIAIVNDRFDLAATLIDLGADADDGSLYYAVEMRDATTDWYARDGSRLRPDHDNERTALDLIALLLEAGADPNKAFVGQMHSSTMCCDSQANASPFYRAAVAADVEALKLLIEHGADLEWTPSRIPGGRLGNNNAGLAAIIVAMNGGRGVPLSAGPGFSREGPPPFREPSNREPAEAVRLLLAAGADPDAVTPDGAPALHRAVDGRNLDVIRALTEAGANVAATNKDGLTALEVALSLPPDDPDANPFGPRRTHGGASPEDMAALLRAAADAAHAPAETHASAQAHSGR
jgi:uncharacterized protein